MRNKKFQVIKRLNIKVYMFEFSLFFVNYLKIINNMNYTNCLILLNLDMISVVVNYNLHIFLNNLRLNCFLIKKVNLNTSPVLIMRTFLKQKRIIYIDLNYINFQ